MINAGRGPGTAAAVVALKPFAYAKSRLDVGEPMRRQLAWSMAADTLRALAEALSTVLVITDEPGLRERLAEVGVAVEVRPDTPASGMNPALDRGAAELSERGFDLVLAGVGDLPALRPESIRAVIGAARTSAGPRSFIRDSSGIGTTMLIARQTPLLARFSGNSATAHRNSGAVDLVATGTDRADARRDVDSVADLVEAETLGLGPITRRLLEHHQLAGLHNQTGF